MFSGSTANGALIQRVTNAGYSRFSRISRKVEAAQASWKLVVYHVPKKTRHYLRRIRRLMKPQDTD